MYNHFGFCLNKTSLQYNVTPDLPCELIIIDQEQNCAFITFQQSNPSKPTYEGRKYCGFIGLSQSGQFPSGAGRPAGFKFSCFTTFDITSGTRNEHVWNFCHGLHINLRMTQDLMAETSHLVDSLSSGFSPSFRVSQISQLSWMKKPRTHASRHVSTGLEFHQDGCCGGFFLLFFF